MKAKNENANPLALDGKKLQYKECFRIHVIGGPCCPEHLPVYWSLLEKYLVPDGHLNCHSETIIQNKGAKLIFDHHERGAEIIAYLGSGTDVTALLKSTVNCIAALINAKAKALETRRNEKENAFIRLEHTDNGSEQQESNRAIMEISIPVSPQTADNFAQYTAKIFSTLTARDNMVDSTRETWDQCVKKINVMRPSLTVTFHLNNSSANTVRLAGTFNLWKSEPMTRNPENESEWTLKISLPIGKHLYKFVVDDSWMIDPSNPESEVDWNGNLNSVLHVKAFG